MTLATCETLLPMLLAFFALIPCVQAEDQISPARSSSEIFQHLDRDSNGELTIEEFLALPQAEDPLSTNELQQRLLVFDMNQSATFSLAEFETVPGIVSREKRGPLPEDPLLLVAQTEIDRLLRMLPTPVSAGEFLEAANKILPASVPLDAAAWDPDGDGQVTPEEVRRSLEITYGVRRLDGVPTRQPSGFVFNGSYFHHLDADGDRCLSRKELVTKYHLGQEAALEFLTSADANQDGKLEFAEIDRAGLFQTDVPGEFLKWDHNFDGKVSSEELQQGAAWQRHLAPFMLPAFDTDGDGQLSLREYQCSPLGNPLFNWTSQRRDRNGDSVLDLQEFFGKTSLYCSGLTAIYFQRLDQNSDKRLDLKELSFRIDPRRLSAPHLIKLSDRNADQQLSLTELFSLPGRVSLASATDLLIPGHALSFTDADQNQDSMLSAQELATAPELFLIAEVEAELQWELLPRFTALDQNGDHQVSKEEWKDLPAELNDPERRQAFLVADVDDSATLSFPEYCSIPHLHDLHRRPWVFDPILDQQRQHLSDVRKHWPVQAQSLSASELVERLRPRIPAFSEADLPGWDVNRDGAFDLSEIQFGLQKYFGIKTPSGEWLRRPNGQVFNWRTAKDADQNHDQQFSRQEFFSRYWKQGNEAEADFQSADFNQDQQLSLTELLNSHLFWIDTQLEFLRFDDDKDGFISPQEILEQSRDHEKRMARFTFPHFDRNHDQLLSFHEFRLTPLANPVHDYESRRWDQDFDGQLSLMEFHRDPDGQRWGLGLTDIFFRTLDRNRDRSLSFTEMKSSANLKRLPSAAVFERLDTDLDGQIQLAELLAREQPRNQSAWAKRNAEQRSMEVEEAFLAADLDRSRGLSLAEFQEETASIRDVVLGVTLRRPQPESFSASKSVSSANRWRTIAIVAANVCLFLGIGIWRWRRYQQV